MILGVLQARVSSIRLPGKVLKSILGMPMLLRQIERVSRARHIDRLIVATSDLACDEAIAKLCAAAELDCFRGSESDVLDRTLRAARNYGPSHVVRLTGDCPLADPGIIDQTIELHLESDADYTSNVLPPTFPDGLDVEILRFEVLELAWREARLPFQREHVTSFVQEQPERFRIANLAREEDLSALRWTVDEAADFAFVEKVYERLHPVNPQFDTADILMLLGREPRLQQLNAGIRRDEGMGASLEFDRKFLRSPRDA